MKSVAVRWLALMACVVVVAGCGRKRAEPKITPEQVDLISMRQEIKQAKSQVQEQRQALMRLREVVEDRIATMDKTMNVLDRALDEVSMHLPAMEGQAAADAETKAAAPKGMSARWVIVLILVLVLIVVVVFALKVRQTQKQASEQAWPDSPAGGGTSAAPRADGPQPSAASPAEPVEPPVPIPAPKPDASRPAGG